MYNKIFVSIASYKDPELLFTIESILTKAKNPDQLKIVVCQQEDPEKFINIDAPNVKFINHHFLDSQGVCWARHQITNCYNNEPYFLQIDSHIAMVENWDEKIIDQIKFVKSKGSEKVVFATYPRGYKLENNLRVFLEPYNPRTVLRTDNRFKFIAGVGGDNRFIEPIHSPYLNAGFMFGDGSFYIDCPYDPEIYFNGEEILNTVKAFTNGYDIFNPSLHLAWHLYKYWEASEEEKATWPLHHREEDDKHRPIRHWERERYSEEKIIKILSGLMPEVLGTERTLEDYESYIGRPVLNQNQKSNL